MQGDNFLGHPEGNGPGHQMVELGHLVVAVRDLGEARDCVVKL
jgi:hypothetical protein